MAIIISWYIVLIDKINTKEIRFGEAGLAIGFRHRNESANLVKNLHIRNIVLIFAPLLKTCW